MTQKPGIGVLLEKEVNGNVVIKKLAEDGAAAKQGLLKVRVYVCMCVCMCMYGQKGGHAYMCVRVRVCKIT
jgi:hypothetical protein